MQKSYKMMIINYITNKSTILATVLAVLILAISACRQKAEAKPADIAAPELPSDEVIELPMPVIPDSLTERRERALYAAMHFWDELDFNDTILSADERFMSQNFANFSVILAAQSDSLARAQAAANFLEKAACNPRAFELAKETAERYLAEHDSPVHDNNSWLAFTDVLRNMPQNPKYEQDRYEYHYASALKNREGIKASDFEYELRNGKKNTLHKTPTGTKGLLVFFYDPDCDHCKKTAAKLRQNETLGEMIDNGRLKVLAVAAETERNIWLENLDFLPDNWKVAFNTDEIAEREIYDFPSMPVIYLLDKDYKVISKDPTLLTFDKIISSLAD